MSLLAFDQMGRERFERAIGEKERRWGGNERVKGLEDAIAHSAALGARGPAVCHSLWHTSRLRWRALRCSAPLLCSAATISHQHISSSTHFTPIAEIFFFFTFHLVQRSEGSLPSGTFGGDCCESAQINLERQALGELCVFGRSGEALHYPTIIRLMP